VNRINFMQKANYYLKHETERLRIAEAGYEMVRSKHSGEIRAAQLIAMIRGIVETSSVTFQT
jgi:spore maturation protein CgeB